MEWRKVLLRRRKPEQEDADPKLRAVQGELRHLKEQSDDTLDYADRVLTEIRAVEAAAAKAGKRK